MKPPRTVTFPAHRVPLLKLSWQDYEFAKPVMLTKTAIQSQSILLL